MPGVPRPSWHWTLLCTGVQGLALARQALYHLSRVSRPFLIYLFFGSNLVLFYRASFIQFPPTYASDIARITDMHKHTQLFCWNVVLLTFSQGWPDLCLLTSWHYNNLCLWTGTFLLLSSLWLGVFFFFFSIFSHFSLADFFFPSCFSSFFTFYWADREVSLSVSSTLIPSLDLETLYSILKPKENHSFPSSK
jgi:hypothetical protein